MNMLIVYEIKTVTAAMTNANVPYELVFMYSLDVSTEYPKTTNQKFNRAWLVEGRNAPPEDLIRLN